MNEITEFLFARLEEERLDILNSQNGPLSRALDFVQRKSLLQMYVMYPDDFPRALNTLLEPYLDHSDYDPAWS